MLKLGVTGGIGAGKSVVTKVFSVLGAPVYDADSRAKFLMEHSKLLIQNITNEFGVESYLPDGRINKPFLSKAFSDSQKLAKLNALVHPEVGKDFSAWVASKSGYPYVVKEAALMFESGSHKLLDKIITVFCPEELRISRVLKRDPQRTVHQIKSIIDRQMPENRKLEMADFIVYNDEQNLIVPQVLAIEKEILK